MSARLVFLGGAMMGREVAMEGHRIRVGREKTLELPVPDADAQYVSRLHATLTLEDGTWWVSDENSTNGTYLNGARVIRSRLSHGDVVQFGRGGPEARLDAGEAATALAPAGAVDGRTVRAPAGAPNASRPEVPLGQGSGHTRYVHGLVEKAVEERAGWMSTSARLSGAAIAVAVLVMAAWGWSSVMGDPAQRFERMSPGLTSSVFLIQTGYMLDDLYLASGHGTGFAASEDGLIITNKHVVYAERFIQNAACLHASVRRAGYDPDRARVVTVWQGGTTFRQARGDPRGDLGLGWSSRDGVLEIAAAAPDNLTRPTAIVCVDQLQGDRFSMEWRPHQADNADIAVLRVTSRLAPIPLADDVPDSDEPVMVFGFPAGLMPQETNVAEPIRRTGTVLRVQETIQIDAPVLGGNSGGPLINRRGEVVGITTRGHETSLQNNALKIDFARRVLERARVGRGG